jgi:hypothetical protein
MNYSRYLLLAVATLPDAATDRGGETDPDAPALDDVLANALQVLRPLVEDFRRQPVSPPATHAFEQRLQEALRGVGRTVTQWTYNHLEPADAQALPAPVRFEAGPYTRLNAKTPQNAWTLFGPLRLWRVGYRPSDKSGDPTIFPLALGLGLVQGASPALAGRVGQLVAEAGMTQQRALARLRQEYGVGWGVKKLRQLTAAVSAAVAEQRQEAQVEQLLSWLGEASAGTGPHKPVLSSGRDGINLGVRVRGGRLFEVATTGTVSVLDRRGRRLGTVYLAHTPESGQGTMSRALTGLLTAVLARWHGPLPRLCYVTDAGDNETAYYEQVLRRLKHPRTGEKVAWIRVVDYYHASERLWVRGELLLGKGQRSAAWVRKMRRWLLKPGGANGVLHSAAALREQYELRGKKRAELQRAYVYLRERMAYLRYADYRRWGIPLGSGVTEAGCKTVYTQRLKLSGMSWGKAGAQTILDLRVVVLSGVWDEAYARVLAGWEQAQVRGQRAPYPKKAEKAA